MAKAVAALFNNNSFILPHCLNSICRQTPTTYFNSIRYLYGASALGIDGYEQSRRRVKEQFTNMSEKFRTKMSEYVKDEKNNIIFTEDLKNMIHLAESNSNDVKLVVGMMKKFNQQNKELRFGSFIFGPVVMRMFHHLNTPDVAKQVFTSPELEGFFDQLVSYQLLLDLLYENKMYDEVLEVFQLIKNKQIQGTKYPKNIIVLVMAACYKKSSAESVDYALNLWKELREVGHIPMRRAVTFCACLVLNHGNPKAALEIVSSSNNQNYMTVRNIRVAALADIGRIDDALPILKNILNVDSPNNTKQTVSRDVVERIRIAVDKYGSADVKQDFLLVEKYLKEQGHVTDEDLDKQLSKQMTAPFVSANRNLQQQNRIQNRNQYQGQRTSNYRVFNQRPGLDDMN